MKQGSRKVTGSLTAIIAYLLVIAVLTALLSVYMTDNYLTKATENGTITAILILSALIANMIGLKIEYDKRLISSLVNLFVMVACLFIISAGIDGPYQNVGLRLGAIIIGLLVSNILGKRRAGRSSSQKRRSR